MAKRFKSILITWDAIWSIPAAGVMLMCMTLVARWLNPLEDLWGLNQVQDIFVAGFKLMVGNLLAQIGIAINLFLFFGYSLTQFKTDFKELTIWQKFCVVVACYLCYFIVFALLQPH